MLYDRRILENHDFSPQLPNFPPITDTILMLAYKSSIRDSLWSQGWLLEARILI